MKERFLPIGTVVLLKGAKKELMITSYCVFPTGTEFKNGEEVKAEQKMYEYGGCPYPEGILDSNAINAFNHDQIDKILHMGYETDSQKEFSRILNGGYKIYKDKFETANPEDYS